jgi:hypothetical protein
MLFGHAGHYYDWLAVIICTAFAASGLGYISAAIASDSASYASSFSIVAAFLCSVFAGVEPSLVQVSRFPVVSWPWYISYATWTAEATYITWSKYLTDNDHLPVPLQDGADQYGYTVTKGLGRSVGAMIAIGIALRIIATIIFWRHVSSKSM